MCCYKMGDSFWNDLFCVSIVSQHLYILWLNYQCMQQHKHKFWKNIWRKKRIYCTWRAKTRCQIMFTCHSKLTRTKTICELFMTCHPNMTNVLIAFVFLFTGKQKSGCRQLQVFNHRWHCCMFAYKSYFMLIWCNLV